MHRTTLIALLLATAIVPPATAQVRVTPVQSKGGMPRYARYAEPWVDIPDTFRDLDIPEWPVPTDLQQWQEEGRGKVRATLFACLGEMPPRPAADRLKVLSVEDCGAYTLERFEFHNGVDMVVPGVLAIPKKRRGKAPVIIGMHGHSGSKDDYVPNPERENSLGWMLVQSGYAVAAIDGYFNGERVGKGPRGKQDDAAGQEMTLFKLHLWQGRTLWGMMLRDEQCLLDYLATREELDMSRVGATGMSMGCTRAWWLAAIDDRVHSIVGVACFTRYTELLSHRSSHGIYYFVPGLLKHFDTEAIYALVAPRPMLMLSGDQDYNAPPDGIEVLEKKIGEVYQLYGKPKSFRSVLYKNTGHEYLPEMREEMIQWFQRTLPVPTPKWPAVHIPSGTAEAASTGRSFPCQRAWTSIYFQWSDLHRQDSGPRVVQAIDGSILCCGPHIRGFPPSVAEYGIREQRMTTSVDVRRELVDALRLDLVGPCIELGNPVEVLSVMPSIFYRTGFLVPIEADELQRVDETVTEEVDVSPAVASADENEPPEAAAARRAALPSSLGMSLLVAAATKSLTVTVRWGDYRLQPAAEGETGLGTWKRIPCMQTLAVEVPVETRQPKERDVPESGGLRIAIAVRPIRSAGADGELPAGTRSVSLFLVNRRQPRPDLLRDEGSAFQAELEVSSAEPLVPRPNVRNLADGDWDERVADLQFRDACEFAVGHGISTQADVDSECNCRRVRTCWVADAQVERVAAAPIAGVTLEMETLAALADGSNVKAQLSPMVTSYRDWIVKQKTKVPASPPQRKEIGFDLLKNAEVAARRIEQGIALLADAQVLEAFRLTNKVMAASARQRFGVIENTPPDKIRPPAWRPFQLAFVLMNLPGIADPKYHDREVVDLLFFPTGGGKTEAYLGLAAFTLTLRRLRNPGISSSGLTVLMRYTLRLLTLDQLSRASTLICALELERRQDVTKLGEWPFEIGLWVGKAATPNLMGEKGDNKQDTARQRTIAFKRGTTTASPIPLENCPWCGEKFGRNSFQLMPDEDQPTDLRVMCLNRHCAFSAAQNPSDKTFRGLPVLAVDEPIYRRLPCFLIATVDKFAAMPWTGEVGAFFGRVERSDNRGFYGPCHPGQGRPLPDGRLSPPDLVIQDELHLISGPLGTIVGLYESALEELCVVTSGDKKIRPKIIASTATVRRADAQIRALFARDFVDVFPPPGPDRRDSFFAQTESADKSPARLYVGIAAQGRSPKVLMLQTYVILLAAAEKAYRRFEKSKVNGDNPADPYMTLLGYFNSLRELGGARRIVEDEVGSRLATYANRLRVGETEGPFANRKIAYEPVELTSRVSTDKVSQAKRRLALLFTEKERVDVALATNMISVGLDITRLGLMVVSGQPKTSAEYIQATSRVGRDANKPGLVVTLLNIHKPRDRSHYERFAAYHETFYRSVEATSVTPFSPRALDRGLAGTLVALVRQSQALMTPPRGAGQIVSQRPQLSFVADVLGSV